MINRTDRPSPQSRSAYDEEKKNRKTEGGKFLTFYLAGEEYGIEILSVYEIIGMMAITRVPGTQEYICGIINLRGKVVPIVDLRKKFGMEPKEYDSETCIVVVNVHGIDAGIVVDRVSEVITIPDEDIEPAPSFGKDVNFDYILGIGKSQSRIKILLDIDRVISSDKIIQLQKTVTDETQNIKDTLAATAT